MTGSEIQGAVLLAVLAVYIHASYCDIRRREVDDLDWEVTFAFGAFLFGTGQTGLGTVPAVTAAASIILIAADLMWDRDESRRTDLFLYAGIAITAAATVALSWGTDACFMYASVPAVYLLMTLLYYTGAVRGGADAKAVIALSTAFPYYVAEGMPQTGAVLMFPPVMSVLLLAALMTLCLVPVYLTVNAVRRDLRFPSALMGFRMRLDEAEGRFVWPLTRAVDGELVDGASPDDSDDALDELREAGADTIWVTPIIPFVVPITAAFALVLLFGNPLLI